MIDDLTVGLGGNPGLAILEQLDIMVEHNLHGPVHTAVQSGSVASAFSAISATASRQAWRAAVAVVRSGNLFPAELCYCYHC